MVLTGPIKLPYDRQDVLTVEQLDWLHQWPQVVPAGRQSTACNDWALCISSAVFLTTPPYASLHDAQAATLWSASPTATTTTGELGHRHILTLQTLLASKNRGAPCSTSTLTTAVLRVWQAMCSSVAPCTGKASSHNARAGLQCYGTNPPRTAEHHGRLHVSVI